MRTDVDEIVIIVENTAMSWICRLKSIWEDPVRHTEAPHLLLLSCSYLTDETNELMCGKFIWWQHECNTPIQTGLRFVHGISEGDVPPLQDDKTEV